MGTIARLPCDEAAILAGSCQSPVATNGPWILAATILGSSMSFIDGTVVNVALPALQSALHATLSDVQWVVESAIRELRHDGVLQNRIRKIAGRITVAQENSGTLDASSRSAKTA
ncbi:hypothetical protein SBA3_2910044 [Candidatus Sulfopaludibacter sp. SbA3]|nr:hypothetical protein SBA3_2910044 [Candidatus Sulfopaludibacter sp. SbA3]